MLALFLNRCLHQHMESIFRIRPHGQTLLFPREAFIHKWGVTPEEAGLKPFSVTRNDGSTVTGFKVFIGMKDVLILDNFDQVRVDRSSCWDTGKIALEEGQQKKAMTKRVQSLYADRKHDLITEDDLRDKIVKLKKGKDNEDDEARLGHILPRIISNSLHSVHAQMRRGLRA